MLHSRTSIILRLAVFLLLALRATSSEGAGANPAVAFDSANKLFEEGKFPQAAAAYEELLTSGQRNAAVYFNLGNALFKSGQVGHAIGAYRQARKLTPRDPDVQANLKFARARAQGPSLRPPLWREWLQRLTLNEWTWLTAVSVWLVLLLLALPQWKPKLKPPLRGWILITALVALALCACFAAAYNLQKDWVAVVTSENVEARHGPLEESQGAFTLHDGAELRVLDRKGDWLLVYADRTHSGWVKTNQVMVIGAG